MISNHAESYLRAFSSQKAIGEYSLPSTENVVGGMEEFIYSVHRRMIELERSSPQLSCGGHAGYKLGAVNLLKGVPCLYGPLWKRLIICSPGKPSLSSFIHCHTCEAEVAFYTLKKLAPRENGTLYSMETVWDAIDYVVPVMELCANRSKSAMTLEQRLVDGLMTGGVYLGNHIVTKQEISNLLKFASNDDYKNDGMNRISSLLSSVETTMACNSSVPNRGKATACPMGGPLQSITWLASKNGFDAGQLILSGMTCKVQAQFKSGDTVTATFENGVFGRSKHSLCFQWDN